MIRKDEVRLFLKREIEQGRHLQRALNQDIIKRSSFTRRKR